MIEINKKCLDGYENIKFIKSMDKYQNDYFKNVIVQRLFKNLKENLQIKLGDSFELQDDSKLSVIYNYPKDLLSSSDRFINLLNEFIKETLTIKQCSI